MPLPFSFSSASRKEKTSASREASPNANGANKQKPKSGKYDPSLPFKPRRSVYIHGFDALTYPILYYNTGAMIATERAPAEIIEVGA